MMQTVLDGTGHDSFDIERRWANAYMGIMKTIQQSDDNTDKYFIMCVEYALRVQDRNGTTPTSYFNEVERVVTKTSGDCHYASIMESFGGASFRKRLPFRSFMDFAVWCNLVGYVKSSANSLSKDEILHAAQFKDAFLVNDKITNLIESQAPTLHKAITSDRTLLKTVLSDVLGAKRKEARRTKWGETKNKWLTW
jgi:hypothetical protein